jgi:hypothetical protein
MKRLLLLTALLLIAGSALADEGNLASQIFSPERLPLDMLSSGVKASSAEPGSGSVGATGELNSGKALLLSAIIPGAGEYYAGQKLKAAIFFGVEVLAWTGVIYYYNKGQAKDREFRNYADTHFREGVYRDYEFSLAIDPLVGDSLAFAGTQDDWNLLSWEQKITYLPREGFTHELPSESQRENSWNDKQQYYEMIGKYIHQFGFGWDDVFDPDIPGTYAGDDPGTKYYDNLFGQARRSIIYMDKRHDSNQLLKNSAWGYNIALLNHVASALDASFSVRLMKRKATAQLGFRQTDYNGELVPAGGVNISW